MIRIILAMLLPQQNINNSVLSYGLGAGIADLNGDGWPDLYISNDYNFDYVYINNKNGTLQSIERLFWDISQFSMGDAVADV